MRIGLAVAIVTALGVAGPPPTADLSLALIEYRVLVPLHQVRVTTGMVHDPALQGRMLADLPGFDRRGMILVAGDSGRTIRRHETIGGHRVDTEITIYPATGHGFGGAMATAQVKVAIDTRVVVDCPYVAGDISVSELDLLPGEGMISLSGSEGAKRFDRTIFPGAGEVVDLAWIHRNAH